MCCVGERLEPLLARDSDRRSLFILLASAIVSKPKSLQTFLLLLVLAALWGGSYLFIRIAAPILGPLLLAALRVVLAALTLLVYAVLVRHMPDFKKHWRAFLLLGLSSNAVPFTLISSAVSDLNASIAAILNATTPLFTVIVAAFWLKEKLTARKLLGVALGVFGVVVLMGLSPLPLTQRVVVAGLEALLASCSYAFAVVYARTRFKGVAPMHVALGQLCGSSLILSPLSLVALPEGFPPTTVILAVIALAVFSTAAAYLIYFRLIAETGATAASTVTFLMPFFSVFWGVIFLQEPLNVGMFVGLGVILLSVYLVLSSK
jgi:drug/metabolite transporter (DMT)-like permease